MKFPAYKPRRPYFEDCDEDCDHDVHYLESNVDYLENNADLAIALLEAFARGEIKNE